MADTKITDLTALAGASVASGDLAVVVDVSDTSMAASGTDKKLTVSALGSALVSLGLVGGGTPSGSAGGDLTGTYPNPTLTVLGSATGPLGTASRTPTVTVDTKGRVTALTDQAIALSATGDATGTLPGALTVAKINGVAYNADPLTQYPLIAGRAGGQTLQGGTSTGDDLILDANTTTNTSFAGAARGWISARCPITLYDQSPTFTARGYHLAVQGTTTITLSNSSGGADMGDFLQFTGTLLLTTSGNANGIVAGLNWGPHIVNDPTVSANFTSNYALISQSFITADTKTGLGAGNQQEVWLKPTYARTNSGTITSGTHAHLTEGLTVGAGVTLTLRRGFVYNDWAGSGTVTEQRAIYIAPLSASSINWGVYNDGNASFLGAVTIGATGAVSGATTIVASSSITGQTLASTAGATLYTTAPAAQTANYDLLDVANATAITSNAINITGFGVVVAPVISYSTAPAGTTGWRGFQDTSTQQNTSGSGSVLTGTYISFEAGPTLKTTSANANTITSYQGFRSLPLLTGTASGVLTITTMHQFNASGPTVSANVTVTTLNQFNAAGPTVAASGTLTTRKGVNITDASNSGTLTTNIGVDIAALAAGGTTNLGIRTFADILVSAANIQTDTTTGMQIGTATTQKLGFFGSTPIIKGTAFTQTYSTASHTHAAVTSVAAPAGGTGATAGAYDTAVNRDAMITCVNAIRTDVTNVKNTLNGLIDDLQALGLIA